MLLKRFGSAVRYGLACSRKRFGSLVANGLAQQSCAGAAAAGRCYPLRRGAAKPQRNLYGVGVAGTCREGFAKHILCEYGGPRYGNSWV